MRDARAEARRWLAEAGEDLETVRVLIAGGRHAAACFYAHQAAEKAGKAIRYLGGERFVLGHGVADLFEGETDEETVARLGRLDEFYIPTRYPNGLPGDRIPSRHYTADQARDALDAAVEAVSIAKGKIEAA